MRQHFLPNLAQEKYNSPYNYERSKTLNQDALSCQHEDNLSMFSVWPGRSLRRAGTCKY